MGNSNWTLGGCAVLLFWATAVVALPAQKIFTTLYSFDGTHGANPNGGLVQGTDGNFYGTTINGVENQGQGTIFKITPSGTLTVLYTFCAMSGCPDGQYANGGLVQATDGNFYGTTMRGGATNEGTVFKITPAGALTVLYSFCPKPCSFGRIDPNPLIQGADGNFYGTTLLGGRYAYGTVFKITPGGTLTTLYSFCVHGYPCTDGESPSAALVQGADGNFYGTTTAGGAYNGGTFFKITPSGTMTKLHDFDGRTKEGVSPAAALIQATDGNFYGTMSLGGANTVGTVAKLTPTGMQTTLYSFCSLPYCKDGSFPSGALIQASDGNLYGATSGGGGNGRGTAFEITLSGKIRTLYYFCSESNCADGYYPNGALVQDTNGKFYGTTG